MEEVFKHGSFSWNELTTTDTAGALAFYTGLFGWTTEVKKMDGPTSTGCTEYTIVKVGDRMVGGIMKSPPGVPTVWTSYVTVDNVDETAKQAESLGGKVMLPPTDIPHVGRFAILIDPQGAAIAAITYSNKQ